VWTRLNNKLESERGTVEKQERIGFSLEIV
jgi:hypothetical protein